MVIKTPVLYNAALTGFLAGSVAGRAIQDATQADYNNLVNEAVNFATEVDATVGSIVAVESAGASFVPATAANTNNLVTLTSLMFGICFAARMGQYRAPSAADAAASFLNTAAAINALFLATTGNAGFSVA